MSEYKITTPETDSPAEKTYYTKRREYLETTNAGTHDPLVPFDNCIGKLKGELRNAQRALSEYKITTPETDSPDERIYYMKTREYLETINADMHKLEGKVRDAQEELSERAERRARNAKRRLTTLRLEQRATAEERQNKSDMITKKLT